MTMLATSVAGFALFVFQLVIALYLLRLLALKTAGTTAGQGLATIIY